MDQTLKIETTINQRKTKKQSILLFILSCYPSYWNQNYMILYQFWLVSFVVLFFQSRFVTVFLSHTLGQISFFFFVYFIKFLVTFFFCVHVVFSLTLRRFENNSHSPLSHSSPCCLYSPAMLIIHFIVFASTEKKKRTSQSIKVWEWHCIGTYFIYNKWITKVYYQNSDFTQI